MKQIGMLDSQVIRAALLALVGLAGLIASFFGVDEALFSEKAGRLVEALLLVLTTGSVLWAAYARATKPTPPITDAAAEKTQQMQTAQGGYARPATLVALALLACSVAFTAGCVGARSAYKAADTLEEYAYVVTEHYAALVREAVTLRQAGALSGSALAKVQAADNKVAPKVLALKPLVDAYAAVHSAENEAALQAAVDDAVRALAELVREIRGARVSPGAYVPAHPLHYAMVQS